MSGVPDGGGIIGGIVGASCFIMRTDAAAPASAELPWCAAGCAGPAAPGGGTGAGANVSLDNKELGAAAIGGGDRAGDDASPGLEELVSVAVLVADRCVLASSNACARI